MAQSAVLIALNLLYVGFGAVLGLIQGGLPPLLMAGGSDIGQAGWAYAFYMPFGLAFLWAPLIDRWQPAGVCRRRGWVTLMQLLTVLAISGLALSEQANLGLLIALGFTAAFAMATMDLALDGLAVEHIAPRFRGWAAGSKLAALSLGAMLGGGVLLAQFEVWGQRMSFLLLAGLLVCLLLPFLALRLPEMHSSASNRSTPNCRPKKRPASLIRLLAEPAARRRLAVLAIVCAIIFPATGLNRLMLMSLGVPVEQIGWIVGTLGPVGMILASAAAVPLINIWGNRAGLLVFCGIGFAAICLMLAGVVLVWPLAALVGAVIIGGSVGGIFVVYAAMILGWAKGVQPVTDYAAYYGISRFVAALAMMLSAQVVQHIDWAWYFAILAVLFAALMFYFYKENHH